MDMSPCSNTTLCVNGFASIYTVPEEEFHVKAICTRDVSRLDVVILADYV